MARVPSKHGRDQTLDFHGFLNDLQDWELSHKEKDKRMKPEVTDRGKFASSARKTGLFDQFSKNYDSISRVSSNFTTEDGPPSASSEKELGNEYFKQKKFKEAIDCYSRSIALAPTAVAYANRAMSFLKLRRFQEAEDDCTEALNLDDRYIKAYSRRATARKELGKFKGSMEDAEFALRLEPHNQEIKKQYAEAKALHDKEILGKISAAGTGSVKGVQQPVVKSVVEVNRVNVDQSVSSNSERTGLARPSQEVCTKRNNQNGKQDPNASVQNLASRAASRAKIEAAKNISPPNSAYQFELSWRGFSGDRALQARFLKSISPHAIPQIFKNSLSAPILIEVIKCIATFFAEETELAVNFLEDFTKVPRFDMIIMCLSSADRNDLSKIWQEVFCETATPTKYVETVVRLRPRYCLK